MLYATCGRVFSVTVYFPLLCDPCRCSLPGTHFWQTLVVWLFFNRIFTRNLPGHHVPGSETQERGPPDLQQPPVPEEALEIKSRKEAAWITYLGPVNRDRCRSTADQLRPSQKRPRIIPLGSDSLWQVEQLKPTLLRQRKLEL